MKSSFLPLLVVLVIGVTACQKNVEIDEPSSINQQQDSTFVKYAFFVAGHVYGTPGGANLGVHPPFKTAFQYINEYENMLFGVLTGDMVYNSTPERWDALDDDLEMLDMPVYFAAGNHDVINPNLYQERYGDSYYAFMQDEELFVVLNPNLDEWNISGEQLDFLINTLNLYGNEAKQVLVFFHQVLWWSSNNTYQNIVLNSTQGRADNTNFWSTVVPLFENIMAKTIMFAGDVGANPTGYKVVYCPYSEKITFVASGMGGMVNDNFIVAEVLNDGDIRLVLKGLNCADDWQCLGSLNGFLYE